MNLKFFVLIAVVLFMLGILPVHAATPVLNWSTNISGASSNQFGSPVIANDSIFFAVGDAMFSYSILNGTRLWVANFTTGQDIYTTPILASGFVVVADNNGSVVGLNAGTGAIIWNTSLNVSKALRSSPALDNTTIYVVNYTNATDDTSISRGLFAINISNGVLLSVVSPVSSCGPPKIETGDCMVLQPDNATGLLPSLVSVNATVYVPAMDIRRNTGFTTQILPNTLQAYNVTNPLSMTLIWNKTLDRDANSTPVILSGSVILGTSMVAPGGPGGGPATYALEARNITDGAFLWNQSFNISPHVTLSAINNSVLYTRGNILESRIALTGALNWTYSYDALPNLSGAPASVQDMIFVTTNDLKNLSLVNATSGTQIWSDNYAQKVVSSVAISNNSIFVLTQAPGLYVYNISTMLTNKTDNNWIQYMPYNTTRWLSQPHTPTPFFTSLTLEPNHTLFFNNVAGIANVSTENQLALWYVNATVTFPNGSSRDLGNGSWTFNSGGTIVNLSNHLFKADANGTYTLQWIASTNSNNLSGNANASISFDVWNNVTYSRTDWIIVTGNNTNQSFQLTLNRSTNETINTTCEHIWPNQTDASNFTYGCEPSNKSNAATTIPWIVGNGTFNVWARAGGSSIFKTYLWNVSLNISDSGAYLVKNISVSYALASTSATLNWTNPDAFGLDNVLINTQKCQNEKLNVTGNVSINNINYSYAAVPGFPLAQGTASSNSSNFNITNGTNFEVRTCFTPTSTATVFQNYWYAYGNDANGNPVNMSFQNISQMIPMTGTPTSTGGGGGAAGGGGGSVIGCPEGYYVSGNTCLVSQTKARIKSENFSFFIRPNEFVQEITLNDLGPNTSISWTFAIYNNETQADKLLYPVWKFTCTPEQQSSCLANWCQISPLFGTNQGTKKIIIASSSFERFKLSCIVPSNVTINQPYYGTILIYPEDYGESKAKKLSIELTSGVATKLKTIVGDNPLVFWVVALLIIIAISLLVAKLFRLF